MTETDGFPPEPDETQAALPEPDESQDATADPEPDDDVQPWTEPAETLPEPRTAEPEPPPFIPDTGVAGWLRDFANDVHRRLANLER